ncbi:unnamed protein product [Ixodes pacificus]
MSVMQETIQVAQSIINPEIIRVLVVALIAILVAGAFMSSAGQEDGSQGAQQPDTAPAGASDGSEVQGYSSRHERAASARNLLSHPPFRI